MSDPVFFKRGPGLSLAEILQLTGARPARGAASGLTICDIAVLERAGPADLTFAESKNADRLRTSQAGACLVRAEIAAAVPERMLPLVIEHPYRAFVLVAAALYPNASRPSSLFEVQGAAASALVHSTARLEAGVTIDPAAIIGPRAQVGAGTLIGPMAVIGPDVRIGRDCSIGAGAVLTNALLGDRVVIHGGCRVGQDSPFAEAETVKRGPQVGRVILQDKVEIGANSTVDRGTYRDTVVGEGTWVDSLVRIASNVMVGRFCKIAVRVESQISTGAILSVEESFPDNSWIAPSAVGRIGFLQTDRPN